MRNAILVFQLSQPFFKRNWNKQDIIQFVWNEYFFRFLLFLKTVYTFNTNWWKINFTFSDNKSLFWNEIVHTLCFACMACIYSSWMMKDTASVFCMFCIKKSTQYADERMSSDLRIALNYYSNTIWGLIAYCCWGLSQFNSINFS